MWDEDTWDKNAKTILFIVYTQGAPGLNAPFSSDSYFCSRKQFPRPGAAEGRMGNGSSPVLHSWPPVTHELQTNWYVLPTEQRSMQPEEIEKGLGGGFCLWGLTVWLRRENKAVLGHGESKGFRREQRGSHRGCPALPGGTLLGSQ